MKKIITVIVILVSNLLLAQSNINSLNLMPYPESVELKDGKFRIDESFNLSVNLESSRLEKTSNRFLERLAKRTGLFLEHPFSSILNSDAKLQIDCKETAKIKLGIDESYKLEITKDSILLISKTDIGSLYGLETLLQLLSSDENGYYFPNVKIKDAPRFTWRGLLIDVGRHFMPVDVIKRNLDAMAAVKMNVLHWHLSEDQGFRIESKVYPKLHKLGSDGFYYTHSQIKDIVNYAEDRGIRVIPEIDIPGHSTAILTAYPELASGNGPYEIERKWGVCNPTLNPTIEKTYEFLENLFKELTQLFPDEYFHIGGDENNGNEWAANEDIQEFMKKNNLEDKGALQGYFNQRVLEILTNLNRKMIGWDEILHPSMPKNIVIQSWRGQKFLIESAKRGYQTMLSNGYYIDLIQPTDYHYLNDPIPSDAKLTLEEEKFVLGGEATMWGEFVSKENIDSRIWPRTAAIAERFWSPRSVNDVDNMYERLESISYQLEEHGLLHIKNIEMMLRRLTNNNNTEFLSTLISVIEPVKIYKRNGLRRHTQQSPLTRVIDVATADARAARDFRKLVDEFLLDAKPNSTKLKQIKTNLKKWQENHSKLEKTIAQSPILLEIKPISENLKTISELGLEILKIKESGRTVDENWLKEKQKIIDKAKVPVAQTELMIVSAIEKLINSIK